MTHGLKDEDDRSYPLQCSGYSYPFGQKYYRTWAGDDRLFPGDETPHAYSSTMFSDFYGRYRLRILVDNVLVLDCHKPLNVSDFVGNVGYWNQSAEYALLSRLQKKINLHDWNAGVFVGELGETVDLMADTFRTLATAYRHTRKGNFGKAASVLGVNPRAPKKRSLVNDWLALRYGWRPLLHDIYNLSEAVKNLDVPRTARFKASYALPIASPGPWGFHCHGKGENRRSIVCYAKEKAFHLDEYLGLTDPLSIGWELIPFSFVVDWCSPIGSYLGFRSMAARTEGTYVRSNFSHYQFRVIDSEQRDPPGYVVYILDEPIGSGSFVSMQRYILSALEVMLPEFKAPFSLDTPSLRLADAIALLASVVGVGGGKRPLHGS